MDPTKIVNTLLTVVYGVAGALIMYWVLNKVCELLPGRWEDRIKPYVYIAPAFAAISLYLIYPAVQTVVYSFANEDSTKWVGFTNYTYLLKDSDFQRTLFNTLLWMIVVPVMTIVLGLLIATLTDRLSATSEKVAKTIIFMPMAISAVGAGTIWKFLFDRAPTDPQIGLLNAFIGFFHIEAQPWLQLQNFNITTFLLQVIVLWSQVGLAMVLLSAAIKGVPGDTLEAARIDGANEVQIFRRVIVPQVMGTVVTVFITVLISVMKIFDIVYATTNGNFNTNVIGNQFYNELNTNFNNGTSAAIVTMLLLAVIPILYYQVRHFRREEAMR